MIIKTTRRFDTQFVKLSLQNRQKAKDRLRLFVANPFDETLRNHALKGKYFGYRSIDVTGDVRIIYKVENDLVTILAFVGTHSQLY